MKLHTTGVPEQHHWSDIFTIENDVPHKSSRSLSPTVEFPGLQIPDEVSTLVYTPENNASESMSEIYVGKIFAQNKKLLLYVLCETDTKAAKKFQEKRREKKLKKNIGI